MPASHSLRLGQGISRFLRKIVQLARKPSGQTSSLSPQVDALPQHFAFGPATAFKSVSLHWTLHPE